MVFVKAWFGDRAAHTCAPRTPFYSGCRWRCLPGFLHRPYPRPEFVDLLEGFIELGEPASGEVSAYYWLS